MSDVSVRATAVTPAPMDYKVPGAQEIAPKSVTATMDGTSAASGWYPCLQLLDPAGNVMFSAISQTQVAAGASADVSWFPHLTPAVASSTTPAGVILETFFYDTSTSSASSATVLTSGQPYVVTVQGTYSAWNEVLDVGTPNADAMFPGSVVGRVSTQVGVDAETIFAWPHDHPHTAGHDADFQLNLGSGFVHIEPQGGPYTTPQPNYLYRYSVTGQGSVLVVRSNDTHTDDYGKLQVTIQGFSGASSGGGSGGSLVPPQGSAPNGDVLTLNAGLPAWEAAPGGGSVTNVSSADTSIVVTNPTTTPSLQLATLDVIATNEKPVANWSNNSHKITGVTAGAATGEAAIYDQTDAGIVTAKGDIVAATGSHAVARFPVGSDTNILVADSTQAEGLRWATAPGTGSGSTINVYGSAGGSWSKPVGTNQVQVICIGSGGGGGGGFSGTGAASVSGGGGGGGGAVTVATFQASDVGGTVTVTVGAGGGGGAAGVSGGNGHATTFGTLLQAGGGGGGTHGASAAAANSGVGGSPVATGALNVGGPPAPSATAVGATPASAVSGTANGNNADWGGGSGGGCGAGLNAGQSGGSSINGGPGGGSGGSSNTTNGTGGGAGGATQSYTAGGGATPGTAGNPGNSGTFTGPYCGAGGGGGGSGGTGVTGGKGGGGGIGAGGGGGGSSANGTGGAGGNGGDGRCIVISW